MPSRRQIVYFIEEAKLGGPQVQMVRTANTLKDTASVHLIFPEINSDGLEQICKELDVSYCKMPISRLTREFSQLFTYAWRTPIEIYQLMQYLKKTKPDLVHVWGGSWQFKGAISAWLANTACVWLLNDTLAPNYIRIMFKFFAKTCNHFIFASSATKAYYDRYLPKKSQSIVIQSMVDAQGFDPDGNYKGDDDIIKYLAGYKVIGLIANINPVKGIDTFIRVAARAQAAGYKCKFVVVGPVFERQQRLFQDLQSLASELGAYNVVFAGARSDVRPLLRRFDVYLCTSLTESSPVSVWEAMMMGKPIVSTPVGDIPEFVIDGITGFIAPIGDDAGLWLATERLILDDKLRLEIGNAARAYAVTAFSSNQIAARTSEFYESVCAHHCPATIELA